MSKAKKFSVPGVFHKIPVKLVTQKWLGRFVGDKSTIACYVHEDVEIFISKELSPQVKIHSFYHEISHHIIETLDQVDEETRCDVLGAYLMKLGEEHDKIKKRLSESGE